MEVEIEFSELEKYIDEHFEELIQEVKMDGFRQGKIPRAVFVKKFGDEYLLYEAVNPVLDNTYKSLLKTENLKPVSAPYEVDIEEVKKGQPVKFTFKLDVEPEVKIKKFKGLKVKKDKVEVTAEDLAKDMENIIKNYMSLEESNEPISEGCMLEHSLITKTDKGEDLATYTKDYFVTKIGSHYFSAEFEKNLLGMKKDETKSFTAKVKDDHTDKNIAGQTLAFTTKINKVHKEKSPEINDEFIKKISGKDTVAEFNELRREQMLKDKEKIVEDKYVNDLMEALIEENGFDVPPAMINDEVTQMMHNFEYDLNNRYRINLEAYLKIINKSQEDLKKEYQDAAGKRVRINLIIKQLITQEKLEVSEDEIKAEVEKSLPEKMKDNASLRQYYHEAAKQDLLRNKALELIKNSAK